MRTIDEVTNDIHEAVSTNADFESVVMPLYDERRDIIKHDRNDWEDKNYSVDIDCPLHITHSAKLFIYGHRYEGIWECPVDGSNDTCPHFDTEVEEIEDTDADNSSQTSAIDVCVRCKVAVVDD
jgi:hypothetical protein